MGSTIDTEGDEIVESYFLDKADSAWNAIDSLKISKLFAENGFKAAIYLYPPMVGTFNPNIAKWIIFLYHYEQENSINNHNKQETYIQIFPNPTNKNKKINLNLSNTQISYYKIFNSLGLLVDTGNFLGDEYQIDMSKLNEGSYFLQLSNENNNTGIQIDNAT